MARGAREPYARPPVRFFAAGIARGALLAWAALSGPFFAAPLFAQGADAFETWLGVDFDRHLFPAAEASCREAPLAEPVPGFLPARDCAGAPDTARFAAEWNSVYRNAVRRDGEDGGDSLSRLRHDDFAHALTVRARPARLLSLRLDLATDAAHRDFSEGSIGFSFSSEPAWRARAALAAPLFPWLVPTVAGGFGSDGRSEAALGLAGEAEGFRWAFVSGRQAVDFPMTLRLDDYAPFAFPLQLRRAFHAARAGWKGRRLELSATGRLTRDRHPEDPGETYTASDSGQGAELLAGIAWSDSGAAGRWRAALEGQRFEGSAVFRGLRERQGGLYQFAYLETRARSAWLRADLALERGPWRSGAFAGAGALRWDAYRPDEAAGRHLWDRNAVLDSYQGGLIDLFSRQTWLFDGRLGASRQSAGGWAARAFGAWDVRAGAGWSRLDVEAHGLLTRRTSRLIIAAEERDYALDFPGLEAHLLAPELSLARRFPRARARLELSAAQAVPLSLRLRRADEGSDGGGTRAPSSAPRVSGGTRAGLRATWSLP